MRAPEQARKPGWGAVIGQSVQRDPVLLPAVLIALVGTGFAVIAPPAWLARVPTSAIRTAGSSTGSRCTDWPMTAPQPGLRACSGALMAG